MRKNARHYRGMGDVVSELQAATDADTVAGMQALTYFWQDAQGLNPQMPRDFGLFMQGLEQALVPTTEAGRWPGYVGPLYPNNPDAVFKAKVAGIGTMINTGGTSSGGFFSTLFSQGGTTTPLSDDQVQTTMQALANLGGGKIPADFNSFAAVLTNSATTVNFTDALWYTVTASAANVVQGAQAAGNTALNVGQGALTALNTFAQYETYLLAGAAALAGYVAYTLYLKPLSPKQNPKQSRPKRRRRQLSRVESG